MKTLVAILLLTVAAFAQGGAFVGSPVINGVGQPIANASVAVTLGNPCGTAPTYVFCNGQAQGIYTGTVPPPALTAVFTDITLGMNAANPIHTDPLGNWTVYATPGVYWAVVYGYQIVPQVQIIVVSNGQGGGGSVNCATALNGSIAAFLSPTSLGCDHNMGTDFLGNGFSQSWTYRGPVNGFYTYIGGGPAPGTNAAYKLPANAIRFVAPATVGTSYYVVPPATRCTVGQVWGLASETTDGNGDPVDTYQCQNSAASNGVRAQTNAVDNSNCTAGVCPLVNLQNGIGTTASNPSGGIWQLDVGSRITTPSAPTLANQNAAGARSITYEIQVCEDGPTCALHTLVSATANIANANASPQVKLTAYMDTLFGGRCANVIVTADSGARTGVPGVIANCVGKQYIDTGANANGVAATNTNTTVLIPTNNPTSGGCNYPNGSPQGVDGLPCSPFALSDEFTDTANGGTYGDANNPKWTQQNWGTTTATLTNGELIITPQLVNAQNQLRALTQPMPASPPHTYETVCHTVQVLPGATGVGNCGLIISDGTKAIVFANGNNSIDITRFNTLSNSFNAFVFGAGNGTFTVAHDAGVWVYLRVQDTGTNFVYSFSFDRINWAFPITESRTAFLTPSLIGIFAQNSNSSSLCAAAFDWFRESL